MSTPAESSPGAMVHLSPTIMREMHDSGLLDAYRGDVAELLASAIGRYFAMEEVRDAGGRIIIETKPLPFFGDPIYRELLPAHQAPEVV